MNKIKCPQCGAQQTKLQEQQKIITCTYCLSSFFIETIIKLKHSIMLKTQCIKIRSSIYHLIESNQMQYDQGIITEWLVKDTTGKLFILTEDDENFSLTTNSLSQLKKNDVVLNWHSLQPNTQINLFSQKWLVTEKRKFHFPDVHPIKQTYLTSDDATILILQFYGSANNKPLIKYRQGFWLDSFEIEPIYEN